MAAFLVWAVSHFVVWLWGARLAHTVNIDSMLSCVGVSVGVWW
ncbi:MAG: hypothetical protein ACM3UL_00930 [Ignavibacteria bacterium]